MDKEGGRERESERAREHACVRPRTYLFFMRGKVPPLQQVRVEGAIAATQHTHNTSNEPSAGTDIPCTMTLKYTFRGSKKELIFFAGDKNLMAECTCTFQVMF